MTNNAVNLIIAQEAQRQVTELTNNLKKADAEILSMSANARALSASLNSITLPSNLAQLNASNAQLTAQIQAQAQALQLLQAQYDALATQRSRNNNQSAEEAVNQRLLNRNARELATTNSALAGAYGRLSAEQARSSRALQDLVVRGRQAGQSQREYNRELQRAQLDFNNLNARVLSADQAVGRFNRNVGNYPMQAVRGIKDLIGAFGIAGGVSLFATLAKDIFTTTSEIISLDNALKLVTGTQENFAIQQSFLSRVSEAYGVEIKDLTQQFTQFYVSAKDKLAGNEIQQIFESITKAGASMGLSTQNQERAFLALNQMMSKGTIQAEELRGQLGEALPGALGIMAKAVGVNEVELGKMMKSGQLLSAEVLPKFAKQLEITYGIDNINRIDNLTSAQSRLSNAWTDFVRSLDEDGNTLSKFFSKTLGLLADLIKGTTLLFQSEATKQQNSFKNLREKGYNETLQYYNSLDKLSKDDLEVNKAYMSQKILDAKKEVDIIRGRNLILKNLEGRTFGMSSEQQKRVVANESEKKSNDERLLSLANVTSSYLGQITAINSLLEPKKKIIIKNDEESKSTNKKTVAEKIYAEGTEKWLTQQIAKLKEVQSTTADTTSEYKVFTNQIELLEKALKALKDGGAFAKPAILDTSTEAIPSTLIEPKDTTDPNAWMKQYAEDVKNAEEETKRLKEATDNFLKSFSSEFFQNSGLGSLETFFDGTFDKLLEGADTTQEKFAVTFNAIAESAQEAFNFISDISQQNFDAEYARLESQKETALLFAGDSASARTKIEEDAEKKKKQIAEREFKAKQKQAIFNIAIDTAQAIVSTYAQVPKFDFGVSATTLALIIGGIGAAQIGVVASQKVPQYFDGTDNHIGGMMLVNDGAGSNYQEKVILPNGKEIMPEGRNVLMNAPKGTKVLTHEQQIMQMLNERGISMHSSHNQNNGMTAQEMDSVMAKHFSKIQTNVTNIDQNGFRTWSESNGNKTIRNNNRVSRTGYSV